jgi:hypothetical protein
MGTDTDDTKRRASRRDTEGSAFANDGPDGQVFADADNPSETYAREFYATESHVTEFSGSEDRGNESYPTPVSDPAADGLPETADPDSLAFDEVAAPRVAEGLDPAPLPPDRDDGPLALDEYGTTPDEGLRGEPLAARLAREVPDLRSDLLPLDPDPQLAEEADPDALDQVVDDSEILVDGDGDDLSLSARDRSPGPGDHGLRAGSPGGADRRGFAGGAGQRSDEGGAGLRYDDGEVDQHGYVEPRLGSQVSVFDRVIPGVPTGAKIGRLVAPDEGGTEDAESDEIAEDVGASGGGASAEELAMHEIPDSGLDDPEDPLDITIDGTTGGPEEIVAARAAERAASRTGADQPWEPADLAVAEGHDPTPDNVERARHELEEWGPAAIEKTVP